MFVDKQAEVLVSASMSLSASRLCCLLTPIHSGATKPSVECPVASVGEGQYKVMIQSSTSGLHQLRVLVDEVAVYGSPFTVCVIEWKRQNLVRFASGLKRPCDVAITDDGKHVVVAENEGHCVTVFSSTGKVVRKFGSLGNEPGMLKTLMCVAVSADAYILLVDITCRLQKFTFTSSYVASCYTGGFGVAVHPASGKFFCTSIKEHKIMVLNADLTPSYSFASDLFEYPFFLAIDTKGMVYVTDFRSGVILKFTPEGEHLATIGSKGEQPHQFGSPTGICIDSNDIMYVTDDTKHRLVMFTTEGEFLGIFGRTGTPNVDLAGVAVDNSGDLYVCYSGNREVLVSRPSQY